MRHLYAAALVAAGLAGAPALADDIKEVYSEAKSAGFDVKIMRQLIRLRKMEPNDRNEMEEVLSIYMRALGMA